MSDEFELSELQRDKLVAFITRADAVIGDGTFDPEADFSDPELMALSLKAAIILGYDGAQLEQLFHHEFELSGVTKGDLSDRLAVVLLADVEERIRSSAGGRN
jgi:hypothetical protein